ncbi:MAG: sensor histidine kinase [Chloroflexi bacterium]|nr:MAG: sensor histidine kinase [Chloroflexota bacterium]
MADQTAPHETLPPLDKTQRFPLSRWLHRRGIDLERQLFLVQWGLPLVLSAIVFIDEFREHILIKREPLTTGPFMAETLFFGVVGPFAVWLVLMWIRGEWRQRERDQEQLRRTYEELARAQERLNALHQQRGELLNRILSVQEEERRRVSREIHDELGQLLTGLSLNLRHCREVVPQDLPEVHEQLARISDLVQRTMEQAHEIIVDLRPTALDDYGLEPAVREELHKRLDSLGIDVTLQVEGDLETLSADSAVAAFRIIQEAITNIIRHAHARHVAVQMKLAGDRFSVLIEDDGVGVNWARNGAVHQGVGILGMKERAAALGGEVTVEARQPRGTRVRLWVPHHPVSETPASGPVRANEPNLAVEGEPLA